MSNNNMHQLIDKINQEYKVEASLCEIIEKRWSYIYGTKNFIYGKFRIQINDSYGIIVDCDKKQFEDIYKYISDNQ